MSEKKEKKKVGRPRSFPRQALPAYIEVEKFGEITSALDLPVESGEKGTRNEWLKQLAELMYVTTQNHISIDKIQQDPRFNHLTNRTLAHWCADGRWVEKRAEYFERLKLQLERKIGNALVRAQYEQLRDLDELSEQMKNMLRNGQVEPKSYEGIAQVLLRVEEFRRAERVRLAGDVMSESFGGNTGGAAANQVTPDLSDEEARHLATEIMKLRQKKIREKLQEENPVEDVDGDTVVGDGDGEEME